MIRSPILESDVLWDAWERLSPESVEDRVLLSRVIAEGYDFGAYTPDEQAISDIVVHDVLRRELPWLHGGAGTLRVNAQLRPAVADPRQCGAAVAYRDQYVFFTHSRQMAEMYASHSSGEVWQVEPSAPIIVDPTELRSCLLFLAASDKSAVAHTTTFGLMLQGRVYGFASQSARVVR